MSLFDIVKPRICELGKIKIGHKGDLRQKRDGSGTYRLPEKLDHFLVTNLIRDDSTGNFRVDEIVMSELATAGYADPDGKIRQLPIALLSNDIEDVLQARYLWYHGARLAATSDGQKLMKYIDTKGSTDPSKWGWLKEPVELPWNDEYLNGAYPNGAKLFKMHATFNCMLALKQSRFGGAYRLRTTSQISASQIYGSLSTIRQATGGYLRGVPLLLAMRPMDVSPGGVKSKVYVVHVELIGEDLLQIQNMVLERARIELQRGKELEKTLLEYRRILNAPGENESVTEKLDTAEEFHPEETLAAEGISPSQPAAQAPPVQADPLMDVLAAGNAVAAPPVTAVQTAPVAPVSTAPAAAVSSPANVPPAAQAPVPAGVQAPVAPAAGEPAKKKRGRPPNAKPAEPKQEPWDQPAPTAATNAPLHGTVPAEVPPADPTADPTPAAQSSAPTEPVIQAPKAGEVASESTIADWEKSMSRQIEGTTRSIHIQKLADTINEAQWVPEDRRDLLLDKCYSKNLSFAAKKPTTAATDPGMFK